MKDIDKTIEALRIAEKTLDQHIADPKNYNSEMASFLEIISWDISRKISDLQELCYFK